MIPDTFHKKLGNRISTYRRALHLTQGQLSQMSGLSKSFLGEVERGEHDHVSVSTLYCITEALHITLSELLMGIEEPDSEDCTDCDVEEIDFKYSLEKACYPHKMKEYLISTLLEFIVYLPLIDLSVLIDYLIRLSGDIPGNEDYALNLINQCIKDIPHSEARMYADEIFSLLTTKKIRTHMFRLPKYHDQYVARLQHLKHLSELSAHIKYGLQAI